MDEAAPFPCRICGNSGGNGHLALHEMVFGLAGEFDYVTCGRCGSVQIRTVPDDLARYYPAEYGPLGARRSNRNGPLRVAWRRMQFAFTVRPSFRAEGRWYELLRRWEETDLALEAVARHRPRLDAAILDVGCGRGRLLHTLEELGYRNLRGIDPFLTAERTEGRVSLRRSRLEELPSDERYDVIVLHHSLEHVPDPIATLVAVERHLLPDGEAIVATPMVAEAFRQYGADWYQLDAPRHLNVFSPRGFELALGRTGLARVDRYFNSTSDQFRISERYAHGEPMTRAGALYLPVPFLRVLSLREARWRRRARELNEAGEGDQAVFYLRKRATATAGDRGSVPTDSLVDPPAAPIGDGRAAPGPRG